MQILPESVTSLWNDWELRILVLLSLLLQIILIILGSRRKYCKGGVIISCILWIAYLSADSIATLSLGNLASNQQQNNCTTGTNHTNGNMSQSKSDIKDQVLQALWAPFLLLHLGGPDTITAYSLEDNSLWARHLLTLIAQIIVAFYIFLSSWGGDPLAFIAIPVFVSGVIKYAERNMALSAASPDQFEDSLLSSSSSLAQLDKDSKNIDDKDVECVLKGYSMFSLLKHLYADLSLTFAQGRHSCSLMVKKNESAIVEEAIVPEAFELVEVQLGFLFDVLYTKATVIYSGLGLILRLISLVCILFALVAFHIVVDNTYPRVDVAITYTLFVGAIFLEVYAFVSLLLSDWMISWSMKYDNCPAKSGRSLVSCFRRKLSRCAKKRWSGSMAQLNLVDICLKKSIPIGTGPIKKFWFELTYLFPTRSWVDVDEILKSQISAKLLKKYKDYKDNNFSGSVLQELLSRRGKVAAREYCDVVDWSFDVEFDHSILLWHVATDICHNSFKESQEATRKVSKILSNYVLYILLLCPMMLPKWIDRITHVRDTFNHAIKVLHRKNFPVKNRKDACKMLVQLHTQCQVLDALRSEKTGKSVLFDACRLALQLQNNLEEDKLWKMICGVWIEMLTYAASHSEWGSHAQQLRNGGELLTHVALLMANIGLSEHFVVGTQSAPIDNHNEGWGWAKSKLASPDARLLASPNASLLANP